MSFFVKNILTQIPEISTIHFPGKDGAVGYNKPKGDPMSVPSPDKKSLLEIHLAVALFGFPGLFARWVPVSPVLLVLGRVFFAALALSVIILARGLSFRLTPLRDVFLLLLCGALLAMHWTTFFQSVRVSSVAVGLLSYSTFPVFTAFLEPLVSRDRLDRRDLVPAGACFFGVFLIIPRFSLGDSVVRGVLWGLVSGATFAVLTVFNRKLSQRRSSLHIAFYQDLFAGVLLLPFFFTRRPVLSPRDILLLAVLGVFCTALAHTLFIHGMKRIRARAASIISSLEPVYGVLLALIFLGEVPALRTILGGTVILGAALAVTRRTARER
jgi:drug/metabolite transporter (DMT)-like permease